MILQLPKIILNKETILYLSHKNANELLKNKPMSNTLTHVLLKRSNLFTVSLVFFAKQQYTVQGE